MVAPLNCCSPTHADVLLPILAMIVNGEKAQSSVSIVWKSVIKHTRAPHAYIHVHLSQRQSRSSVLQPNNLTEVYIATKQLGIFFLQLPSIQWIW